MRLVFIWQMTSCHFFLFKATTGPDTVSTYVGEKKSFFSLSARRYGKSRTLATTLSSSVARWWRKWRTLFPTFGKKEEAKNISFLYGITDGPEFRTSPFGRTYFLLRTPTTDSLKRGFFCFQDDAPPPPLLLRCPGGTENLTWNCQSMGGRGIQVHKEKEYILF